MTSSAIQRCGAKHELTREGLISFRTSCPSTSSGFQLVRDSLLQAEGLPFSDALSVEHIEQAFQAAGVSFAPEGGAAGWQWLVSNLGHAS